MRWSPTCLSRERAQDRCGAGRGALLLEGSLGDVEGPLAAAPSSLLAGSGMGNL
jgi:hypothetical protein